MRGVNDVFTYRIADANGGTDTATLTIRVNGEEEVDAPVQNPQPVAPPDVNDAPTSMALVKHLNTVNEHLITAVKLATVNFTDPDTKAAFLNNKVTVFQIDGKLASLQPNLFEIKNGNELWTREGRSFDYELKSTYTITLRHAPKDGERRLEDITYKLTVDNVPEKPSVYLKSPLATSNKLPLSTGDEQHDTGVRILIFDPDSVAGKIQKVTYKLSSDKFDLFSLGPSESRTAGVHFINLIEYKLVVKAGKTFTAGETITLTITGTDDSTGKLKSAPLTVNLTASSQPEEHDPVVTISNRGSLNEGTFDRDTSTGITFDVTDGDSNDPGYRDPTVTLSGGGDRFKIVGQNIVAKSGQTFDPGETITLTITATDTTDRQDTETVTFRVRDIEHAPTLTITPPPISQPTVPETTGTATTPAAIDTGIIVTARDADKNLRSLLIERGQADGSWITDSRFEVQNDKLFIKASVQFDYEHADNPKGLITLRITASDPTKSVSKEVTVQLTNVDEKPTSMTLRPVSENISFSETNIKAGGLKLATVTFTDPDGSALSEQNNGVTLSIPGEAFGLVASDFEFRGGGIYLKTGANISVDQDENILLRVTPNTTGVGSDLPSKNILFDIINDPAEPEQPQTDTLQLSISGTQNTINEVVDNGQTSDPIFTGFNLSVSSDNTFFEDVRNRTQGDTLPKYEILSLRETGRYVEDTRFTIRANGKLGVKSGQFLNFEDANNTDVGKINLRIIITDENENTGQIDKIVQLTNLNERTGGDFVLELKNAVNRSDTYFNGSAVWTGDRLGVDTAGIIDPDGNLEFSYIWVDARGVSPDNKQEISRIISQGNYLSTGDEFTPQAATRYAVFVRAKDVEFNKTTTFVKLFDVINKVPTPTLGFDDGPTAMRMVSETHLNSTTVEFAKADRDAKHLATIEFADPDGQEALAVRQSFLNNSVTLYSVNDSVLSDTKTSLYFEIRKGNELWLKSGQNTHLFESNSLVLRHTPKDGEHQLKDLVVTVRTTSNPQPIVQPDPQPVVQPDHDTTAPSNLKGLLKWKGYHYALTENLNPGTIYEAIARLIGSTVVITNKANAGAIQSDDNTNVEITGISIRIRNSLSDASQYQEVTVTYRVAGEDADKSIRIWLSSSGPNSDHDKFKFVMVDGALHLQFKTLPNFEQPHDSTGNNIYELKLATNNIIDGGSLWINIRVTDDYGSAHDTISNITLTEGEIASNASIDQQGRIQYGVKENTKVVQSYTLSGLLEHLGLSNLLTDSVSQLIPTMKVIGDQRLLLTIDGKKYVVALEGSNNELFQFVHKGTNADHESIINLELIQSLDFEAPTSFSNIYNLLGRLSLKAYVSTEFSTTIASKLLYVVTYNDTNDDVPIGVAASGGKSVKTLSFAEGGRILVFNSLQVPLEDGLTNVAVTQLNLMAENDIAITTKKYLAAVKGTQNGETVTKTYTIKLEGPDAVEFTIAWGVIGGIYVLFRGTPDYDDPSDGNIDSVYEFDYVVLADGNEILRQSFEVTITDDAAGGVPQPISPSAGQGLSTQVIASELMDDASLDISPLIFCNTELY